MGTLSRDTIVSILLLLFCGFLIWAGTQIRDPLFCLIYFLQSIRAGAGEEAAVEPDRSPGVVGWVQYYFNPIICFALYFLFLLTLPFFGTLIGGVLLGFALLSFLGGIAPRQVVIHAIIAALAVGAMWSLFTFGLGVLLPRGTLFQSF